MFFELAFICFMLPQVINCSKIRSEKFNNYLITRDSLLTELINDSVFQLTFGTSNTVEGYTNSIQTEIVQLEQKISQQMIENADSISVITLPNEGQISAKLLRSETMSLEISAEYRLNPRTEVEEVFTDFGMNGFEIENNDKYEIITNGEEKFLTPKNQILFINFRNLLAQLLNYFENSKGDLPQIETDDISLKYPYEIPEAGLINWKQIDTGLEFTLIDVLFQNKLVDRIAITRIDPNKYSLETYNDYDRFITKNGKRVAHYGRKTIEEWQNLLGSNVIINGSYYKTEPYGKALAQMLENGERKGETLYSTGGTLLFEPKNENDLIVKVVDHLDGKQNLENYNYLFGTNSYPALYDTEGNSRSKKSYYKWRATRTNLGVDNDNKVLMGNTQEGFFALWRLGHFLQKIEHQLKLCGNGYVLNMDGGLLLVLL